MLNAIDNFRQWLTGTLDFIHSFEADLWVDPEEKLELNSLLQVAENRVEGLNLSKELQQEGKEVLAGFVRLNEDWKKSMARDLKIRFPKNLDPVQWDSHIAQEIIKRGGNAEKKVRIQTRIFYMDHRREYLGLLYQKKALEEGIMNQLEK